MPRPVARPTVRALLPQLWLLAGGLSAAVQAQPSPAPQPLPATAALFAAHCAGCHGHKGRSVSEFPTLAGRVGYFTRLPAGRAYLVQVPGVALSTLSDAQVADVMNWLLRNYSREQLAPDFAPYTRDEVAGLRRERINPWAVRAQVVRSLVQGGLLPSDDALASEPLKLY